MPKPSRQAFTLIQLVAAVIVMAAIIRVALHFEHGPAFRTASTTTVTKNAKLLERRGAAPGEFKGRFQRERLAPEASGPDATPADTLAPEPPAAESAAAGPALTVFTPLHREVADGRGPLLARIVGRVHPRFTDRQVNGLVETLPPCETPPTVLILPSTEKPTDEDKSRDRRTRGDAGCEAQPGEQDR